MTIEQLNKGHEIQLVIERLQKELDMANGMIGITQKRIDVQCETDDSTLYNSFIDSTLINFNQFKEMLITDLRGRIEALKLKFNAL